jgi:hypothetical protein
VAELRRAVEAGQRQLVQWAEEKLSLATIALDLVQQHRAAIEADLGALQYELKVRARARACRRVRAGAGAAPGARRASPAVPMRCLIAQTGSHHVVCAYGRTQ